MLGQYSPDLLNSTSMKMFCNGKFGLTYTQMKFVMSQTFKNGSDYKNPLGIPFTCREFELIATHVCSRYGIRSIER
jgi:hypothetical protein